MVSGTQAACHPREVPHEDPGDRDEGHHEDDEGHGAPDVDDLREHPVQGRVAELAPFAGGDQGEPSRSPRTTVTAPETKVIDRVSTRA